MFNDNLTNQRRIVKALVNLQSIQPFIGYMAMNFKLVEFPKEHAMQTMGVDANFNLYYSQEFIEKEVKTYPLLLGCCAHEILHIALNHIGRVGNRIRIIANIAQDMVVWYLVAESGMQILKGGKYVQVDTNLKRAWINVDNKPIVVNNIDEKSWEKAYDEIIKQMEDRNMDPKNNQGGNDLEDYNFDKHMHESFNKMSKEKQNEYVQNLRQKLSDAYMQNIGKMPGRMERYIKEFLESKIPWHNKILKYVKQSIEPVDYHYKKPHKKSYQLGIYLPGIKKEKIEVDIVVDLSGSIDEKSYIEFISEIYSIIKSFPVIESNIYFGDVNITMEKNIKKSNLEDLKSIKPTGGGGTDMERIFLEIAKKRKHSKLLICLTDGFTTISERNKTPFNIIWVVCRKGIKNRNYFSYGEVIKMED
jgi:predicted metal-dependent peptidase